MSTNIDTSGMPMFKLSELKNVKAKEYKKFKISKARDLDHESKIDKYLGEFEEEFKDEKIKGNAKIVHDKKVSKT